MGNICAKVATNYVTENKTHGSSLKYANELINTQKYYNSKTEVGI